MPIHQNMNASEIMLQAERHIRYLITQAEHSRMLLNTHRVNINVSVEPDMASGAYTVRMMAIPRDYRIEMSAVMLQVDRFCMPSLDMLSSKINNLYDHMDAKINDYIANERRQQTTSHHITIAPIEYTHSVTSEIEHIRQELQAINQRQLMRGMALNLHPVSPPATDIIPCSSEELWKYHKRKDDKNAEQPKPKERIWRRFTMQHLRKRKYLQMAERMQRTVDELEKTHNGGLSDNFEADMLEIQAEGDV